MNTLATKTLLATAAAPKARLLLVCEIRRAERRIGSSTSCSISQDKHSAPANQGQVPAEGQRVAHVPGGDDQDRPVDQVEGVGQTTDPLEGLHSQGPLDQRIRGDAASGDDESRSEHRQRLPRNQEKRSAGCTEELS